MHKNTERTSYKYVRLDQGGIDVKSDVNGREGIVLIMCSRREIYGRAKHQGKIWLRSEVADIECRGAYCRSLFEGATDLIPSD